MKIYYLMISVCSICPTTPLLTTYKVGEIRINTNELPDGKVVDSWYPLKSRQGKKDTVSGDLHITIVSLCTYLLLSTLVYCIYTKSMERILHSNLAHQAFKGHFLLPHQAPPVEQNLLKLLKSQSMQ